MIFSVIMARAVCANTIQSYLSAIRSLHIDRIGWYSWAGCLRLPRLLKGIRRAQSARPAHLRSAVTPDHLHYWRTFFDFSNPDHCTLWAAIVVAFFGLLRRSEFTVPASRPFDPERDLCLRDIRFSPDTTPMRWDDFDSMDLRIKFSKTAQFGEPCWIPFNDNEDTLSPSRAINTMLHACPPKGPLDPLFIVGGRPLSTEVFASTLRSLVFASPHLITPEARITPHSLRIGGASALLRAGAPPVLVQVLGRWRSDAFIDYIRVARPQLLFWSRRMLDFAHGSSTHAATHPRPQANRWNPPTTLTGIQHCARLAWNIACADSPSNLPPRPNINCQCPNCAQQRAPRRAHPPLRGIKRGDQLPAL